MTRPKSRHKTNRYSYLVSMARKFSKWLKRVRRIKGTTPKKLPGDTSTQSQVVEVPSLQPFNLAAMIFLAGDQEDVKKIERFLEEYEYRFALANRASRLSGQLNKYLPQPSLETFTSRWLLFPLTFLLNKDKREEWQGDLYQMHQEMLSKNYPLWFINLVDVLKIFHLMLAALEIKALDIISLLRK